MDQQILPPKSAGESEGLVSVENLLEQIHGTLPSDPVFRDAR
jgi:hypothetical protein